MTAGTLAVVLLGAAFTALVIAFVILGLRVPFAARNFVLAGYVAAIWRFYRYARRMRKSQESGMT